MNIYLVGFMGSGKSTVGRLIAQKLNLQFVDIDKEIEKEQKMCIPDIFSKKGEPFFRELEKEKIQQLTQKDGYVISTGGGLGANPENMKTMKKNGYVVWLDTSLEEVLKRCKNDTDRPLLNQPLEKVEKLYEDRKEVYSQAHFKVKTDSKTPEEIAEEVVKWISSQE